MRGLDPISKNRRRRLRLGAAPILCNGFAAQPSGERDNEKEYRLEASFRDEKER